MLVRLLEEWEKNIDNNFLIGGVGYLSKAFDWVPHDLLITKAAAYGLKWFPLKYIYTYLKYHRQCLCLNNTYSDFKDIISVVPKDSIVGHFLCNAFWNFVELTIVLTSESNNTVNLFSENDWKFW